MTEHALSCLTERIHALLDRSAIPVKRDPLWCSRCGMGRPLTGLDRSGSAGKDSPAHRRLVCSVAGEDGFLVFWGDDANTRNIDLIVAHGFPCTIRYEWREPNPEMARRFRHRWWVAADARVEVEAIAERA